jgi:hypothetical protein
MPKKKQSATDKALVIGESRKRVAGIQQYVTNVNRSIGHLDVGKKYNVGYKLSWGKNVPYEMDTQVITSKKFGEKPTTGPKAYARARNKSKAMPGDQYKPDSKKPTGNRRRILDGINEMNKKAGY